MTELHLLLSMQLKSKQPLKWTPAYRVNIYQPMLNFVVDYTGLLITLLFSHKYGLAFIE
jgi:hypothetical protein